MNTIQSPTHEAITRRARGIWNSRGRPTGLDTEIWLEAERELTVHHSSGSQAPMPDPLEVSAKTASKKKSAEAPRVPTHVHFPKPAPTESGKPLWNKPHSS